MHNKYHNFCFFQEQANVPIRVAPPRPHLPPKVEVQSNKPNEGLLLNLSSISIDDESDTLKSDNLFDLLGSESEKTESKDLFGGFVNASNTSNDILFDPFVSKTNLNVSTKFTIILTQINL